MQINVFQNGSFVQENLKVGRKVLVVELWNKRRKNGTHLDDFRIGASGGHVQRSAAALVDGIDADSFIQKSHNGVSVALETGPAQCTETFLVRFLDIRTCNIRKDSFSHKNNSFRPEWMGLPLLKRSSMTPR